MTNDQRPVTTEQQQATRQAASPWSSVLRPLSDTHFARVAPIVGPTLRHARVALIGLPDAAPIVAYLAACGVGRWLWAIDMDGDSSVSAVSLRHYLEAQHGPALALDIATLLPEAWAAAVQRDPPDMLIVVGAHERALALEAAAARIPVLLIAPPTATSPCQTVTVFPADDLAAARSCLDPNTANQSKIANWDWTTSAPLCAGLARAILLRDTPFRRDDLAELWSTGLRIMILGGAHPGNVAWSACTPAPLHPCTPVPLYPHFHTPSMQPGVLLIAGLGSLGSVAATHLVQHASTLVLADPDRIDSYNPVRQAYPLAAIGRPKAHALRNTLRAAGAGSVIALDRALADERTVAALVERYRITAGLIVTGTAADFAIARALRTCNIPHVVGRCYPRARYWEAIVVDGRHGPALSDLRGHLRAGPAPTPTPEQIAAYSDAGALEAEPATLIESGWAAAWMARLAAQLLAPSGLRERWLLELLAAGQTCLIGGVGVERTPAGPAYGIGLPGEIRGWGPDAIRGRARHAI